MATGSKHAGRSTSKAAGELARKLTRKLTGEAAPTPTRDAIRLTEMERAKICIEVDCSLRTVDRYAAGLSMQRGTLVRMERAMLKLGIPVRKREPSPHGGRRRVVELAQGTRVAS